MIRFTPHSEEDDNHDELVEIISEEGMVFSLQSLAEAMGDDPDTLVCTQDTNGGPKEVGTQPQVEPAKWGDEGEKEKSMNSGCVGI